MYKKILLSSVLIISYLILISILFGYRNANKKSENYYKPVRMVSSSVGGILNNRNDESKIESISYFHIINHSNHEQKVTFVLYQYNILENENCFFDIDYIYINRDTEDEKVIEDGIVTVPAGEKLYISVDATARDSSKALTSRSGPSIKIVVLD